MKKMRFPAVLVASLAVLAGACSHLDMSPPSSFDRVLTGVVDHAGEDLPSGSEVVVRIVDDSAGVSRPEVLGEATIKNAAKMPVGFRIEYRAEDAQLMRSVNVEARVSIGGRLRFTTTTGHPITLGNVNDAQVISVQEAVKH